MRTLVLALAVAAGVKIWVQDSVYRSATEQALISAYRDRAATACAGARRAGGDDALALLGVDWTRPTDVALVVGDRSLPVHLWQLDHELWDARFRRLHLVLQSADAGGVACTYDIVQAKAHLGTT